MAMTMGDASGAVVIAVAVLASTAVVRVGAAWLRRQIAADMRSFVRDEVGAVMRELRIDSGTSLRDAVDRTEAALAEVREALAAQGRALEALARHAEHGRELDDLARQGRIDRRNQ